MVISSNTLFHYTNRKENLIGILKENFKPRYSKENVSFIFKHMELKWMYIPMVCFCDIPLSLVENHVEKYGSYGIGLTKEWGERNKLNPITYVVENSMYENLINLLQYNVMNHFPIEKYNINNRETENIKFIFYKIFFELFAYLKIFKDNECNSIYEPYYNEREWRWVPPAIIESDNIKEKIDRLFEDQDGLSDSIDERNEDIARRYRLKFEPNDIKYLIVQNDDEIIEMMERIETVKGSKYNYNDIRKLQSRIISIENIKRDL